MAQTTTLTAAEFAERFQRASPTLWCIAAGVIADRSGVEDALQEAAMIALGKLPDFDRQTNFTAWMASIVRFVSLNQARRNMKLRAASTDPHAMELMSVDGRTGGGGPVPAGSARSSGAAPRDPASLNGRGELPDDQRDFDDQVLSGLRALDETARCCLLLRTLRDMPYREISLALDIPEGTAMSHVYRARARLRSLLGAQSSASRGAPSARPSPSPQPHPSSHTPPSRIPPGRTSSGGRTPQPPNP